MKRYRSKLAFKAAAAVATVMAIILPTMATFPAVASENAPDGWLGSAKLVATVPFEAPDEVGMETETRLIYESKPESSVGFRAEGGLRWTYGGASETALAFDSLLATPPDAVDLPPGTDLHRVVFLDQAYAVTALGIADLSFGVVPIAWGTGYLFNPTSRTAPMVFPDDVTETAPGLLGSSLRLALPAGFSAEWYAAAEPRRRSTVPAIDEISGNRFPFGSKLQFRSELVDVSISLLRELTSVEADAAYWTGADAAGFLGPVSWYAEAAMRLPGKGGTDGSDWEALDETEACVGISWTVSGIEATFRSEAAWLGTGADEVDDYDVAGFLAGERALLGKRYLFVQLEKEDPAAAKWTLSGGALMNLVDLSTAAVAEAKYSPMLSVEFTAFVRVFLADDGGELGGTRALGGGLEIIPYRNAAGVSAKVSF